MPKLKAMLTDKAATTEYEEEPFNPHAIARLRASAYQRAIVMEIIGTYHDLGDSLFAKDTMESVNEASLYYNRAAEMLGPRPARLGKCHTIPDTDLTYEKLGPAVGKPSELLLMLENWTYVNHAAAVRPDPPAYARPLTRSGTAPAGHRRTARHRRQLHGAASSGPPGSCPLPVSRNRARRERCARGGRQERERSRSPSALARRSRRPAQHPGLLHSAQR